MKKMRDSYNKHKSTRQPHVTINSKMLLSLLHLFVVAKVFPKKNPHFSIFIPLHLKRGFPNIV